MKDKSESQEEHFRRRMRERFGVSVDQNTYSQFVRIIQGNQARFVERQSGRITVWDINFQGETLRVVYDKNRKKVVTALFADVPPPPLPPPPPPKSTEPQYHAPSPDQFGKVRSAADERARWWKWKRA